MVAAVVAPWALRAWKVIAEYSMWKHSGIPVMKSTFSTWLTRSLAEIRAIFTQRSRTGAIDRRSARRYSIQRTMAKNSCNSPPLTLRELALSRRTRRSEDSLRKPSKVMISAKCSQRNLSTLSIRSFTSVFDGDIQEHKAILQGDVTEEVKDVQL